MTGRGNTIMHGLVGSRYRDLILSIYMFSLEESIEIGKVVFVKEKEKRIKWTNNIYINKGGWERYSIKAATALLL